MAYRYFATPRRKFVIADTPGHIQYTRNMVTGASTADLALVLIDARKGIVEQSRRHAFLVSLLRVPHLLLVVNKMDLVDWSEDVFESIRSEFSAFSTKLSAPDLSFIPISALHGDNVVQRSTRVSVVRGPTLLHHLENVHVASDRNLVDVRFPCSTCFVRCRVAVGTTAATPAWSPAVCCAWATRSSSLPSGFTSRIAAIDGLDGPLEEAFPTMSITLRLEDEIDVSRGDMICRPHNRPASTRTSTRCCAGWTIAPR